MSLLLSDTKDRSILVSPSAVTAAAVLAVAAVVGIEPTRASAAAGCVVVDMYAQHTLNPSNATGAKFGSTVVTGDSDAWLGTWSAVGSFTAAGSPSALLSPSSGEIEVVARADDGIIHSTGETIQGSNEWRDWVVAKGEDDPTVSATDPTVFPDTAASGPTWAYVIRTVNNATAVYTAGSQTLSAMSQDQPPTFMSHTLPAPPL